MEWCSCSIRALLAIIVLYALGALLLLYTNVQHAIPGITSSNNNNVGRSIQLLTTSADCAVKYPGVNESLPIPSGTFKHLLERTKQPKDCLFAMTIPFPASAINRHGLGYRTPFYSSDATRFYRCRAQTRFTQHIKFDSDEFRDCCMNEPTFLASKSANAVRIASFLNSTIEGKLWLEAMGRIANGMRSVPRQYPLFPPEAWLPLIPSVLAHSAFPDVNSHVVRLPHTSAEVVVGRNVMISRHGRVTFARGEVFYPKRAPYSHIELMETWMGGDKFASNAASLSRYQATLDSNAVQTCLDKVALPGRVYYCNETESGEAWRAVDTVVVISQTLGSQMFHYMCENLPRLGALLPFLLDNPQVFIHANCPETAGYCLPLFELLGISRNRIIRGDKVLARTIHLPEGGRKHWPISSLFGLNVLRQTVLARLVAAGQDTETREEHCLAKGGRGLRISLVKRTLTRLSSIRPVWYDKLLHRFQTETTAQLAVNFNVQAEFVLFDDTNATMMRDAGLQILELRRSDIIVGAHGAGFSWMPYLKRCSHFISFRSRTNSDIFEQIAFGFGMGFHHVRFESALEPLFDDLQHSIGVAARELVAHHASLVDNIVLVCNECTAMDAERHLAQFSHVVVITAPVGDVRESNPRITYLQHAKMTWCEQVHLLFPSSATRFAWVRSGTIVLSEHILQSGYWIAAPSAFDVLVFANGRGASPPAFLYFNHMGAMEEYCQAKEEKAFDMATSWPDYSLALVRSPPSTGLVYSLQQEENQALAAHFEFADRHGPTFAEAAAAEEEGDDGRRFGIWLRRSGQVYFQRFPTRAFIRPLPSADSLGEFGDITGMEVPFY